MIFLQLLQEEVDLDGFAFLVACAEDLAALDPNDAALATPAAGTDRRSIPAPEQLHTFSFFTSAD